MKKKNKIIILIISILVLVGGAMVIIGHDANVRQCKELCNYSPGQKTWFYVPSDYTKYWSSSTPPLDAKFFPTQQECIDYCLLKEK